MFDDVNESNERTSDAAGQVSPGSDVVLYGPRGDVIASTRGEDLTLKELTEAFNRGLDMPRGAVVSQRTAYAKSPWVYRCVRVIATSIASAKFVIEDANTVGEEQAERIDPRHPLARLFSRPSGKKSFFDLVTSFVSNYLLGGAGFLRLDFGVDAPKANTLPISIYPLACSKTSVLVNKEEQVTGYEYWQGQKKVPLEPLEVVHVPAWSPTSDVIGQSAIAAAMSTISGDVLGSTYQAAFFRNSAQLGGILIHKRSMDESQLKQLRDKFEERHRGAANAYRMGMLSGDWNFIPTGISQREMQWLEDQKFSRDKIAAVFGVPGIFLNDVENSNRSISETEWRTFWESTLLPIARAFIEGLRLQFFDIFAPEYAPRFDYTEVPGLREDVASKIEQMERLNRLGVPLQDIKKMLRLDIPDYPWASTWWINATMVPAEFLVNGEGLDVFAQPSETPQPTKPDAEDEDEDETEDDDETEDETEDEVDDEDAAEDAADESKSFRSRVVRPGLATESELRRAYWRAFVDRIAPLESRFNSRTRRHFMELRREVLGNLAAAGDPPRQEAAPYEKRGAWESFVEQVMFDRKRANDVLVDWSGPLIDEAVIMGGRQIYKDLDLDGSFYVNDPNAVDMLFRRKNMIVGVNDRLYERIKLALYDGLREGDTLDSIAMRLRATFNASSARARTIARTEIATATNIGRIVGMTEAGVETHQWLSARDEHVRQPPDSEFNHAIDGQTRAVGDEFSIGLRWPGDDEGTNAKPGNVINCVTGETEVEGRVLAVVRAKYHGDVFEVTTARGFRVRFTAGHRVLIPGKGFVDACELRRGDSLLITRAAKRPTRSRVTVADLFARLAAAEPVLVCDDLLAGELDGDGARSVGGAQIAAVDFRFLNEIRAALVESGRSGAFESQRMAVGDAGRRVDRVTVGTSQAASNFMSRSGVEFREVLVGDLGRVELPLTGFGASIENGGVMAEVRGYADGAFLEAFEGFDVTAPDRVASVERVSFVGHVFDVMTDVGYFAAGGVVSSNCRCTTIPVVKR